MKKNLKILDKKGKKTRDKHEFEQKPALVSPKSPKIVSFNPTDDQIHQKIEKNIIHIQNIIRETILSIQNYKSYELFSNMEVIFCANTLKETYEKTNALLRLERTEENIDKKINELQLITNKLYSIITNYGTKTVEDLLYIVFGSLFTIDNIENETVNSKYELICNYIHPTGFKYKSIGTVDESMSSNICNNKIVDFTINNENYPNLECLPSDYNIKNFYKKIYGIQVVFHNRQTKKTLIIEGVVDDIQLDFLNNTYLEIRKSEIKKKMEETTDIDSEVKEQYIKTLTLKDMLVDSTEDIVKKLYGIKSNISKTKKNNLESIIQKFNDMDLYNKRSRIIEYLIYSNETEIQYIAYLLYDFIVMNSENEEHEKIYNSFPWGIKAIFKDNLKKSFNSSQEIINKYDTNKITLEQQIYLLKVPENIKEKALTKCKEIKGKPDEIGAKSKQYLEGLVKIPFGNYREEPALKMTKEINTKFSQFIKKWGVDNITEKPQYTNIEIRNFIFQENTKFSFIIEKELNNLSCVSIKKLNEIIKICSSILCEKIIVSKLKTREEKIEEILKLIKKIPFEKQIEILDEYIDDKNYKTKFHEIKEIEKEVENIQNTIYKISQVLDESIYGQEHAKNQIMKIISQWISGEQTGYAFGFEGSPGIGKTSLAKKGISQCLEDENGIYRPFSFIALGGSTNGSTLEGHGYTYLNSSWGRIVDILMTSKCMNPIIYIDELDKVSKSENGKEIFGILTHLIDSTQNDSFQDKFFSGVDIDLSKALFIFSYNDPELIDRILLDRIHRVKFENLTKKEKIVIVKKYILPEINKKMGFYNTVILNDDIIEKIITEYTLEPGVRKLKEVMFDLFGEINIELLRTTETNIQLPITIKYNDLEEKYLKKYKKIRETKIHDKSCIGLINGMWANALGMGGVLPIEVVFFPSSNFLELKLTGLQGEVMKESMNVAKTLAWSLCSEETKQTWTQQIEENKTLGIHIHCPEGAVSKDGPSAGTAITVAIYSLLNKKPINNYVAITGEIDLNGNITAIGGLENKIIGSLHSGITTILYPKDNKREFKEFLEKYEEVKSKKVEFVEVDKIQDVFPYVFV